MKSKNLQNVSEIKENIFNMLVRPIPAYIKRDKYDIPIIRKNNIDLTKLENGLFLVNFKNHKYVKGLKKNYILHNFSYDDVLERYYKNYKKYTSIIGKYYAYITPDFSCYNNMSFASILYNVEKNRNCGVFYQTMGINVIPSVSWGDERTYDICFLGIETGCIVAITTLGICSNTYYFLKGFNEMIQKIKPCAIICIGNRIEGMNFDKICFIDYKSTFVGNKEKYGYQPMLWEWEEYIKK